MTTSVTRPYLLKKLRRSVSVMLEGRPPRNTFGQFVFFLGFCIDRGLHGFGSIVLPSKECGQLWMTPSMLFGSLNVTKPKPRLRPVSAFFITTQSITSPNLGG